MAATINNHPCFNRDVKHTAGRIHLPVAPKCNIQCNFCDRKFDCVNESRPGVSSVILTPRQALEYLRRMVEADKRLAVVGIAGPGDPFANPEETLETLRLVREAYPEMLLCVATNGLVAAQYIEQIAKIGISHMTFTVNAVNPEIGRKVYAWVRDGKKVIRGIAAAELLWERQRQAISLCKQYGITVKVNSILIPGINDYHIPEVAATMAGMKVDLFNCMEMCRVEGTPFEALPEVKPETLQAIRAEAARHLPQMTHCTRCRADAAGCLGENLSARAVEWMQTIAAGPSDPKDYRPYVAVTTREGLLINQHLGQAKQISIYRYDQKTVMFVETRVLPPAGSGDLRWNHLADNVRDCRAILTYQAGPNPTRILEAQGVKVLATEGLIESTVREYYEGKSIMPSSQSLKCGSSCSGGCKTESKGCGCAV